jgi:sortase A
MRDKRPVDELSIEELERILAIRKREARLARLRHHGDQERVLTVNVVDGIDVVNAVNAAHAANAVDAAHAVNAINALNAPVDPLDPSTPHTLIAEADDASEESGRATGERGEAQVTEATIEDKPVTPAHFEGDPRFEDEDVPRRSPSKPRPARQRQEKRKLPAPTPVALATRPARPGPSAPPPAQAMPTPRARLWNGFLMGVEIAAVFGLVALGVIMWQTVQALQRQTADQQATAQAVAMASFVPPTPTPIISVPARVLPSGHKYLGEGRGEFNLDEIPSEYRAQYTAFLSQLPRIRPTPRPEGPVWLRIPAINVDHQVVYGDDFEALKQGIGHHVGSANPGSIGNMVLSAHNDIYGEIFRYLERLSPGDQIIVKSVSREYTYTVQEITQVNPQDVWVLEGRNDRRLTLISCWPYRVNNKRIVVFATLAG